MRYLLAILLGLSVVLGFSTYYYHARANSYCEMWKKSKANTDFLIKQREKDYEATLQISLRNKELESAAAEDKAYFNWSADISNTVVIRKLREN